MSRTRVSLPEDDFAEGKWFYRFGWCLLPKTGQTSSALSVAIQKLGRRTGKTHRKSPQLRAPGGVLREIQQLVAELRESEAARYNAQLKWSLTDIDVHSREDALGVINEFQEFAQYASLLFCWPLTDTTGMHWRKHGWKHVTYDEIQEVVNDQRSGLPPELRIDMIGTPEDARELFRKAGRRDPRGVARLGYLFPRQEELLRAARHIFEQATPAEKIPEIPSVAELAAEYATDAVSNAGRQEGRQRAKLARQNLKLLVSAGAALGSRIRGGRPRAQWHEETVRLVHDMSCCLFGQIGEVSGFLDRFCSGKHRTLVKEFYPGVSDLIADDLISFLELQPTYAAYNIAAKVLEVKERTIEKILYERGTSS